MDSGREPSGGAWFTGDLQGDDVLGGMGERGMSAHALPRLWHLVELAAFLQDEVVEDVGHAQCVNALTAGLPRQSEAQAHPQVPVRKSPLADRPHDSGFAVQADLAPERGLVPEPQGSQG